MKYIILKLPFYEFDNKFSQIISYLKYTITILYEIKSMLLTSKKCMLDFHKAYHLDFSLCLNF